LFHLATPQTQLSDSALLPWASVDHFAPSRPLATVPYKDFCQICDATSGLFVTASLFRHWKNSVGTTPLDGAAGLSSPPARPHCRILCPYSPFRPLRSTRRFLRLPDSGPSRPCKGVVPFFAACPEIFFSARSPDFCEGLFETYANRCRRRFLPSDLCSLRAGLLRFFHDATAARC